MLQLKNISESACQMFIFFQTKKKQAADQKLFEKNIGLPCRRATVVYIQINLQILHSITYPSFGLITLWFIS